MFPCRSPFFQIKFALHDFHVSYCSSAAVHYYRLIGAGEWGYSYMCNKVLSAWLAPHTATLQVAMNHYGVMQIVLALAATRSAKCLISPTLQLRSELPWSHADIGMHWQEVEALTIPNTLLHLQDTLDHFDCSATEHWWGSWWQYACSCSSSSLGWQRFTSVLLTSVLHLLLAVWSSCSNNLVYIQATKLQLIKHAKQQ